MNRFAIETWCQAESLLVLRKNQFAYLMLFGSHVAFLNDKALNFFFSKSLWLILKPFAHILSVGEKCLSQNDTKKILWQVLFFYF